MDGCLKVTVPFFLIFLFFHNNSLWAGDAYRRAQKHFEAGNFLAAESAYREEFTGAENKTLPAIGIGKSLQAQGRGEEAKLFFEQYINEEAPADLVARAQYVDLLIAQSQPQIALEEIRKIEFMRPSYQGLDEFKAVAYYQMKEFHYASEFFQKARAKKQLSNKFCLFFAELLYQTGRHLEGQNLMLSRLTDYPATAANYLWLAKFQESLRNPSLAEVSFRKALQISPQNPELWIAYTKFLMNEKKYQQALASVENAKNLDANRVGTLLIQADLYRKTGEIDQALSIYRRALQLEPSNDSIMLEMAGVYEEQERVDELGLALKEWINKNPKKTWLLLSYAKFLRAIGNEELAKKTIQNGLSERPGDQVLLAALSGQNLNSASVQKKNELSEPLPKTIKREIASLQIGADDLDFYTIQKGDTLGEISTKVYGTSRRWQLIQAENKELLNDPTKMPFGQKIKIPKIPKTEKINTSLIVVDELNIMSSANNKGKKSDSLIVDPKNIVIPVINKNGEVLSVDKMKNTPVEEMPENPSKEPRADVIAQRDLDPTPWYSVSVSAGANFEKTKLDGSGFTTDVPIKMGYALSGEFALQARDVRLALRAEQTAAKYDALSGVSPTSVNVKRKSIGLVAQLYPLKNLLHEDAFFRKTYFGAGYSFRSREAQQTAPRVILTSVSTSGLFLEFGLQSKLTQKINIENRFEFYLPSSYQEESIRTGFHISSFWSEFSSKIFYRMGEKYELGTGVLARLMKNNFEGSDTRSVSNASETEMQFIIPLEMRF